MKTVIFPVVFLILFSVLIPSATAENITLDIRGECREYNVTLTAEGFESACYDAKIDMTTSAGRVGRIYDPREGWKSSFFYVEDDFCIEESTANQTNLTTETNLTSKTSKTYKLKADTSSPTIYFRASLRHASSKWDSSFIEFGQSCPEQPSGPSLPMEYFFLAVLVVILIILAGIALHKKFTSQTRKNKS